MIVKNEAHVIRRCVASVLPLIDHWLVVDTGSSDGTQDVVRSALAGLPGELVERPWVDFASNRTEALILARVRADYSLIIDADDELILPSGYQLPHLRADSYEVDIEHGPVRYQRPQLVKNTLGWRYRGVLHEFLESPQPGSVGRLPISMLLHHDGHRGTDPGTYSRDASILEAALAQERDPFLISRYTFYLAQTYRDLKKRDLAIQLYLRRAEQGFWVEEVFYSLYEAGRLLETDSRSTVDAILSLYERAAAVGPSRAEALHAASRLCRVLGDNMRGYALAKRAVSLRRPARGLFIEPWIYDYGALDEFAINAYWVGAYADCVAASLRGLESGKVPQAEQARFVRNARLALERLPDIALGSSSPYMWRKQAILASPRFVGRLPDRVPRVLVAILAKQKEPVLPLYLDCLRALDYPKSSIVLYISTNNNTDRTREILSRWIDAVAHDYAAVEFDSTDIDETVDVGAHEGSATRSTRLAKMRNISLDKAASHQCDFYFVADVDTFLKTFVLSELVSLNLPIVAPMLRHVESSSRYSNYHADIDQNGYFIDSPVHDLILQQKIVGLFELPVVHRAYLVRSDVIRMLNYSDGTGRHDYVIFSEMARRTSVPQYLDNRQIYGLLTLDDESPETIDKHLALVRRTMESGTDRPHDD